MKRTSTNWVLEIDDRSIDLEGPDRLKTILETREAKSADSICLSLVRRCSISFWTRFVYRFLGAPLEDREFLGRLDIALASSNALAIFQESEDDDGVVPHLEPKSQSERIAFKTPRGEPFEESASVCLPREQALQLFDEFIRTERRPTSIKWVAVRDSKAYQTGSF